MPPKKRTVEGTAAGEPQAAKANKDKGALPQDNMDEEIDQLNSEVEKLRVQKKKLAEAEAKKQKLAQAEAKKQKLAKEEAKKQAAAKLRRLEEVRKELASLQEELQEMDMHNEDEHDHRVDPSNVEQLSNNDLMQFQEQDHQLPQNIDPRQF